MKPTSIIFLIISVILIVGGIITCAVAKDIAVTDGYVLFNDAEGGGSYVRHDFRAADINKIDLVVTDAEINVYGGAEESYIEFFHFRDGLYTLASAGNTITLNEIPDLKSLLSFQGGFSFSGMRYFLRFGNTVSGPKKVNVYIGADSAIKVISVTGKNCTVYAEKMGTRADLIVTADESITLTGKELRTASALTLEAPTVSVNMEDCSLNEFHLTADTTQSMLDRFYCTDLYADLDTGTLEVHIPANANNYRYEITGSQAVCHLNGETIPLPYQPEVTDSTPTGEIVITAGNANVDLTISE